MANENHLAKLRQGVEAWNAWRTENLELRLDLSKADLSWANLSGANLSGANLSEANLSKASLSGADFSWAKLSGADFSGANLSKTNLSLASLRGAILSMTYLSGADFSQADLSGANLSKAILSKANLSRAGLNRANLSKAILWEANLSGVDLSEAYLSEAKLDNANLSGANLSRGNLIKVNLSETDLRRVNLSEADLSEAKLDNANLSGANLSRGNLIKVNLGEADLRRADLSEADLSEATLPLALCSFAKFEKAIFDRTHLWGIQREHWSIKGIRCSSVYWDEKAETLTQYADGDFERLFSGKTKIQIFYKGGLNTLEIVSLPAFIQHLESLHEGCKLRFQSINEASGGAIVEIVIDEGEEIQSVIEQEASDAQQKLRLAFEQQEKLFQAELAGFQKGVQLTLRETLPFMSNNQTSNNQTININSPVVHGTLAGYVQGDVIYNAAQLADAGKLVEALTAKADSIPSLEPNQKQELSQALTTAKTELEKPQPSHPIVQGAISTVRSILEKSAAQWLTAHAGDIWEMLQKLPQLPM